MGDTTHTCHPTPSMQSTLRLVLITLNILMNIIATQVHPAAPILVGHSQLPPPPLGKKGNSSTVDFIIIFLLIIMILLMLRLARVT